MSSNDKGLVKSVSNSDIYQTRSYMYCEGIQITPGNSFPKRSQSWPCLLSVNAEREIVKNVEETATVSPLEKQNDNHENSNKVNACKAIENHQREIFHERYGQNVKRHDFSDDEILEITSSFQITESSIGRDETLKNEMDSSVAEKTIDADIEERIKIASLNFQMNDDSNENLNADEDMELDSKTNNEMELGPNANQEYIKYLKQQRKGSGFIMNEQVTYSDEKLKSKSFEKIFETIDLEIQETVDDILLHLKENSDDVDLDLKIRNEKFSLNRSRKNVKPIKNLSKTKPSRRKATHTYETLKNKWSTKSKDIIDLDIEESSNVFIEEITISDESLNTNEDTNTNAVTKIYDDVNSGAEMKNEDLSLSCGQKDIKSIAHSKKTEETLKNKLNTKESSIQVTAIEITISDEESNDTICEVVNSGIEMKNEINSNYQAAAIQYMEDEREDSGPHLGLITNEKCEYSDKKMNTKTTESMDIEEIKGVPSDFLRYSEELLISDEDSFSNEDANKVGYMNTATKKTNEEKLTLYANQKFIKQAENEENNALPSSSTNNTKCTDETLKNKLDSEVTKDMVLDNKGRHVSSSFQVIDEITIYDDLNSNKNINASAERKNENDLNSSVIEQGIEHSGKDFGTILSFLTNESASSDVKLKNSDVKLKNLNFQVTENMNVENEETNNDVLSSCPNYSDSNSVGNLRETTDLEDDLKRDRELNLINLNSQVTENMNVENEEINNDVLSSCPNYSDSNSVGNLRETTDLEDELKRDRELNLINLNSQVTENMNVENEEINNDVLSSCPNYSDSNSVGNLRETTDLEDELKRDRELNLINLNSQVTENMNVENEEINNDVLSSCPNYSDSNSVGNLRETTDKLKQGRELNLINLNSQVTENMNVEKEEINNDVLSSCPNYADSNSVVNLRETTDLEDELKRDRELNLITKQRAIEHMENMGKGIDTLLNFLKNESATSSNKILNKELNSQVIENRNEGIEERNNNAFSNFQMNSGEESDFDGNMNKEKETSEKIINKETNFGGDNISVEEYNANVSHRDPSPTKDKNKITYTFSSLLNNEKDRKMKTKINSDLTETIWNMEIEERINDELLIFQANSEESLFSDEDSHLEGMTRSEKEFEDAGQSDEKHTAIGEKETHTTPGFQREKNAACSEEKLKSEMNSKVTESAKNGEIEESIPDVLFSFHLNSDDDWNSDEDVNPGEQIKNETKLDSCDKEKDMGHVDNEIMITNTLSSFQKNGYDMSLDENLKTKANFDDTDACSSNMDVKERATKLNVLMNLGRNINSLKTAYEDVKPKNKINDDVSIGNQNDMKNAGEVDDKNITNSSLKLENKLNVGMNPKDVENQESTVKTSQVFQMDKVAKDAYQTLTLSFNQSNKNFSRKNIKSNTVKEKSSNKMLTFQENKNMTFTNKKSNVAQSTENVAKNMMSTLECLNYEMAKKKEVKKKNPIKLIHFDADPKPIPVIINKHSVSEINAASEKKKIDTSTILAPSSNMFSPITPEFPLTSVKEHVQVTPPLSVKVANNKRCVTVQQLDSEVCGVEGFIKNLKTQYVDITNKIKTLKERYLAPSTDSKNNEHHHVDQINETPKKPRQQYADGMSQKNNMNSEKEKEKYADKKRKGISCCMCQKESCICFQMKKSLTPKSGEFPMENAKKPPVKIYLHQSRYVDDMSKKDSKFDLNSSKEKVYSSLRKNYIPHCNCKENPCICSQMKNSETDYYGCKTKRSSRSTREQAHLDFQKMRDVLSPSKSLSSLFSDTFSETNEESDHFSLDEFDHLLKRQKRRSIESSTCKKKGCSCLKMNKRESNAGRFDEKHFFKRKERSPDSPHRFHSDRRPHFCSISNKETQMKHKASISSRRSSSRNFEERSDSPYRIRCPVTPYHNNASNINKRKTGRSRKRSFSETREEKRESPYKDFRKSHYSHNAPIKDERSRIVSRSARHFSNTRESRRDFKDRDWYRGPPYEDNQGSRRSKRSCSKTREEKRDSPYKIQDHRKQYQYDASKQDNYRNIYIRSPSRRTPESRRRLDSRSEKNLEVDATNMMEKKRPHSLLSKQMEVINKYVNREPSEMDTSKHSPNTDKCEADSWCKKFAGGIDTTDMETLFSLLKDRKRKMSNEEETPRKEMRVENYLSRPHVHSEHRKLSEVKYKKNTSNQISEYPCGNVSKFRDDQRDPKCTLFNKSQNPELLEELENFLHNFKEKKRERSPPHLTYETEERYLRKSASNGEALLMACLMVKPEHDKNFLKDVRFVDPGSRVPSPKKIMDETNYEEYQSHMCRKRKSSHKICRRAHHSKKSSYR